MRPNLTSVVGIAAIVGLAIWLAFEHQSRAGLREEHQALEQQLTEMDRLISRNEQLSNLLVQSKSGRSLTENQSRELLWLRGQVGVLRQQSKELETVREENRQARAVLERRLKSQPATADFWPQDSWSFKGFGSADAAMQSSLWAASNGNLKVLLASATGEMQKQMEEEMKGWSETEASIRAMDGVMGMKSVRVTNREVQGDDTVVLTMEFENREGSDTVKILIKKIGDEWKLSGPGE